MAANTTNIATNTTNITNLTDAVDSLGDDSLLWNATAGAFSAKHGTNGTDSKITNLLAGTVSSDSTDAINGSQLYGLADSFTSYLGGGADISDAGVLTGPTYTIGGTDYNNVGDALAAINTSFSTSLGDALLWDATAKGGDGAFSAGRGKDNTASIITNVADGAISSTSSDAINGSQLYDTSKYIADTLGGDAEVNADGTITAPTYAIAGGSYSNVGDALEAIDTTLDDALLWDATANDGNGAFSAAHGKDKTASVITNVANGAISATSSDAINGSQLYTTNKYIADALGGDAEVNADGSITAPTYTIANAEYNNVGDALDALDDNALLWDATANDGAGAYNASHDGKASIITNVADGNIGEGSTDAINGSQLFNTNMLIQQNSEIINQLAGKELFRRDLMYRLDVLRIFLPPLRQRERDAELLFLHLMRQRGQENGIPVPEINISALSVLNDYPFSGNIRELRNIVERSLVICSGNAITRDDLLKALYPQDLEDTSPLPSYTASQTSSEESSILWALRECSGNQTKAARLLGINRSTLWRKMQKYNIKI